MYKTVLYCVVLSALICGVVCDNFTEYEDDDDDLAHVGLYHTPCDDDNPCYSPNYRCPRRQRRCTCSSSYVLDEAGTTCEECPKLGEECHSQCCSSESNGLVLCWNGLCQQCYDSLGYWTCGNRVSNQFVFISATQIAMGTALIMGILATFLLLYKLCQKNEIRRSNRSFLGQLAAGGLSRRTSVQQYVDERLQDAPPRYSRALTHSIPTLASAPDIPPAYDQLNGLNNFGFVHDSSVPPPAYHTVAPAPDKDEEEKQDDLVISCPNNPTLHM